MEVGCFASPDAAACRPLARVSSLLALGGWVVLLLLGVRAEALAPAGPSCPEPSQQHLEASLDDEELLEEDIMHLSLLQATLLQGRGPRQQQQQEEEEEQQQRPQPSREVEGGSSGLQEDGLLQQQQQQQFESTPAAAVNCSAYPMFCHPEVRCAAEPLTAEDRAGLDVRLATEDGHANLRSWCLVYPKYVTPLQKCVLDRDASGYSREAFAAQKKANLAMADAVYCFVAGHCNNTEVTRNTTLLEAERICDAKYGHERWTSIGFQEFAGVLNRAQSSMAAQMRNVLEHRSSWADLVHLARHESDISAMTACAMGNYHCDVVYCQDNYCHDDTYARFAKLSWVL